MEEVIEQWCERIARAAERGASLRLRGGGTKDFYGRTSTGEVLDTRSWCGIVSYEPTELVVTARAGTPLAELQQTLAEHNQMLAFDPPAFGETATVGGCIASGLSGPLRQSAGPLRDFVLGLGMIDGRGLALRFGGQVMKNVAGYDVSRLMAGSMGCLGLITEVSFKVLPRPAGQCTLFMECDQAEAIKYMNRWDGQPLPIAATCWHDGRLSVLLSGAQAGVAAAADQIGGELMQPEDAAQFWHDVREHNLQFFTAAGAPLWRLAVPPTTPPLALDGSPLLEWGGGQRWLRSDVPAVRIREQATACGGHATLFRHGERSGEVFQTPAPALMTIHRRLKQAFDPAGVFNPGRLYDGI